MLSPEDLGASPWDFDTYHIGEQRRLRRDCVFSLPEPSLFAYIKYGSRWRVWPKIRHVAPVDCSTCVFEDWVYGRAISAIISWVGSLILEMWSYHLSLASSPLYHKNPKISDTQKICCNHPKSWTRWLFLRVIHPKDAAGIAHSVDPDQTAPLGAVWSGSALFAHTGLSENLGILWYTPIEICWKKQNKTKLEPLVNSWKIVSRLCEMNVDVWT